MLLSYIFDQIKVELRISTHHFMFNMQSQFVRIVMKKWMSSRHVSVYVHTVKSNVTYRKIFFINFFERKKLSFMTDSNAKIKTTEELLVLKTARKFKRLLELFFPPKKSRNIWPLVPFIILHHFIQTLFMIMPLLETKNTQYLTVTATLARKIHSIISPLLYINLAVWWQKRDVLVEFTQNLNNILLDDQVGFFTINSIRLYSDFLN